MKLHRKNWTYLNLGLGVLATLGGACAGNTEEAGYGHGNIVEGPSSGRDDARGSETTGKDPDGSDASGDGGVVDDEPRNCPAVDCSAFQARPAPSGDVTCDHELGWTFDGYGCSLLIGCACVGRDCDRLLDRRADCESAAGLCRELPPHCRPTPPPPADEPRNCPSVDCSAFEARPTPSGDVSCDHVLGWSFDGIGCELLSGCDCVGSDCDRLFDSREDCESAARVCDDLPPHCR